MLNEILGTAARYNQLLTRKFNITGGAPAPQLTPEISTSLNLDAGIEGHVLQGEMPAYGFMDVTGNAGQRPAVQLRNPTGSNIILCVERVAVVNLLAGSVFGGLIFSNALPTLPVPGDLGCRDTRVRTNGGNFTRPPTGQVTGAVAGFAVLAQANLFRSFAGINTYFSLDPASMPVLAPGWTVQVEHDTVVGRIMVWFAWREVPLAPGEVGPF